MIIIIDDDYDVRFGEVAPPGTLHAATPEAAIELIADNWGNISALFLDHDLGVDAGGNTIDIRPVVQWLEERAMERGAALACPVYIHSMNSQVDPLVHGLANRGYHAQRIPLDIAKGTLGGIGITRQGLRPLAEKQ